MSLHLADRSLYIRPNSEGVLKAEKLTASYEPEGLKHLAKSETLRLDLTSQKTRSGQMLDLAAILFDR